MIKMNANKIFTVHNLDFMKTLQVTCYSVNLKCYFKGTISFYRIWILEYIAFIFFKYKSILYD